MDIKRPIKVKRSSFFTLLSPGLGYMENGKESFALFIMHKRSHTNVQKI